MDRSVVATMSMDHQQLQQLPSGFRFLPDDIDLVDYYLRNRIVHGLQPNKCLIQELDVYQQEPWHLPCDSFLYGKTAEKEMYFITPRHLISSGSSRSRRVNRTCGAGLWDGHARDKPIKMGPDEEEVIGYRNQLAFKLRNGKNKIETGWIMHEFRLDPPPNSGGKANKMFDELVLCRIHKKLEGSKHPAPADQETAERALKRQRTEECGDQGISNIMPYLPQLVSWEEAGYGPPTCDEVSETPSSSGQHCADGLHYDDGLGNMPLLQHVSMPPSSNAVSGTPSTSGVRCCSDGLFYHGGFDSSMPSLLEYSSSMPSSSSQMPPQTDSDCSAKDGTQLYLLEEDLVGNHIQELPDDGFGNIPSMEDILMPSSLHMPPSAGVSLLEEDPLHELLSGGDDIYFDLDEIRSLLQFDDEPADTQHV